MEKGKVQKIRLGFFVIVGTIFFIVAMYFLGEKQNLFGSTFRVYTIFNDVNGLQKGNNVRFSGIDVGTVTNVKVVNDTSILVTMVIEDHIREMFWSHFLFPLNSPPSSVSSVVGVSPISSKTLSRDCLVACAVFAFCGRQNTLREKASTHNRKQL